MSKKAGRPSALKPEFVEQVYKLARTGYTDRQLADFFKVTEQTINNWKCDYPPFFESLKKGKAEFDDDIIEKSLARRAQGFMRVKEVFNPEGVKELIQEEVPPDTTACIFWLKNRQPKQWRDKQEHEVTGKDGAPFVPVLNITLKK